MGAGLRETAGGLNAAALGHVQIHQDDVRLQGGDPLDDVLAVACLPHHLHIRLAGQQGTHSLAEGDMVIGDKHRGVLHLYAPASLDNPAPAAAGDGRGSQARTAVPPSAPAVTAH